MGKCYMKKEIYIPMFGLIAGELIMFYGKTLYGLGIHIINLLGIIFIIIFSNLSIKEKNILQSFSLLIILRVINLSMPQFFSTTTALLQYLLIYGIMFIPIYLVIKNQRISSKRLGINFGKLYIYIPIAIMIGIITALAEYRIINPTSLIDKIRISDVILISIVMFIFIGVVEELIFRSILQTRLEKILGLRYGLLLTGGIFGIMHASYGILNEILFASIFGIILGYIFQKTQNILFTSSIHGTANVILFGILPNMPMSVIANTQNISSYIISMSGEFVSIFLIIILSVSFLISDIKYSNKYISNILGTHSSPLLLVFVSIVISKIMVTIKM